MATTTSVTADTVTTGTTATVAGTATTSMASGPPTTVSSIAMLTNLMTRTMQTAMNSSLREINQTMQQGFQAMLEHQNQQSRTVMGLTPAATSAMPPLAGTNPQPADSEVLGTQSALPRTMSISASGATPSAAWGPPPMAAGTVPAGPLPAAAWMAPVSSTWSMPKAPPTVATFPPSAAWAVPAVQHPSGGGSASSSVRITGPVTSQSGMPWGTIGCMPPPSAIAGVPIFSVAGPAPVFSPGTHTAANLHNPNPTGMATEGPQAQGFITPSVGLDGIPAAVSPGGNRVPPKLAQRIWSGEFIEMVELLPERLGQAEDSCINVGEGESRKRKWSRMFSALQWVECFHTYISVIAQQQPARVPDLLGYASLIVHAARKFKGEGWLQYDKNFRRHAETHPAAKWAEANTSWTLAFCNAQPYPHCDLCFSVDHVTSQCEEYDSPEVPIKRKVESLNHKAMAELLSVRTGTGNPAHPLPAPSSTFAWNATRGIRKRIVL